MGKVFTHLVVWFFFIIIQTNAHAGLIIVNNDEWTLSNFGFSQTPDSGQFAVNVAEIFTGGGSGTFHAFSNNFGFVESGLTNALTGAGHTYSTGTDIPFDLSTLSGFDGIFIGGDLLDLSQVNTLIDYVNGSGNVYFAAGTSFSNPGSVAASFNPFLNEFGLSIANNNNGISGNIDVTGATHPIFDGVSTLFQNNGQTISGDGVVFSLDGQGLYAVADSTAPPIPDPDPMTPIPEPSTFLLVGSGLFGWRYQRSRAQKS